MLGCPHADLRVPMCFVKVLGIPEESGCVSDELYEVHYQFAFPAVSLHFGICPSRHAALWGKVIFFNFPPVDSFVNIL